MKEDVRGREEEGAYPTEVVSVRPVKRKTVTHYVSNRGS